MAMEQLRSELDLIRRLDHPNIVRLQEVFETEDSLYLVMVRACQRFSGPLFCPRCDPLPRERKQLYAHHVFYLFLLGASVFARF